MILLAKLSIGQRIGAGRMGHQDLIALRMDSDIADRQSLADFDQRAIGNQSARLWFIEEIDRKIGGDRKRHRPHRGQNRHIKRQIGQGHHGRPRKRAAGPQLAVVIGEPEARFAMSGLQNRVKRPMKIDLREVAFEQSLQRGNAHQGGFRVGRDER